MKRWWWAHRDLLSEAGLKQPQAAVVKSHGSERWGKARQDLVMCDTER